MMPIPEKKNFTEPNILPLPRSTCFCKFSTSITLFSKVFGVHSAYIHRVLSLWMPPLLQQFKKLHNLCSQLESYNNSIVGRGHFDKQECKWIRIYSTQPPASSWPGTSSSTSHNSTIHNILRRISLFAVHFLHALCYKIQLCAVSHFKLQDPLRGSFLCVSPCGPWCYRVACWKSMLICATWSQRHNALLKIAKTSS